jgi:hypothetical protein
MLSQPGIDTESPVIPQAEFDPPVAIVGRPVTYRLIFNAMNEAIRLPEKLPAPPGLVLTPSARGQTYGHGGAKLLPRTTINYRVLANAVGTYVMPSLVVTVYNKAVTIPSARVTFLQPGAPDAREAQRLVLELPAGDLYVGQAINARIIALDPGEPGSQLQGLSQVQVNSDAFLADNSYFRVQRQAVTRNGRAYPALIHEMTITPIRDGTHQLAVQGHAIITRIFQGGPGMVIQPSMVTMGNPLLESDPLTVVIKSLPREGELPGFTGAIGTFSLEPPRLSTNAVRAGEPVVLTVTIRGDGNIGRLVPPRLGPMREWNTAFAPSTDPSPAYAIQQRGFNTFSYTLVPLSERLKATPAIPFSYFDPKQRTYVSLPIPPVPLTVNPAPAGVTLAQPAPVRSPGAFDEERDGERELVLTGLADSPGRRVRSLAPLQQRRWFPVVQVFPALVLGALWLWDRRRRYLEQHPEVLLKRRARRELRRQLRLARRAAAESDPGGFVHAAINALREVCAPQAAATPEALVCADVLEKLPPETQTGPDGEMVRRLFAAADAHRFGHAEVNGADLLGLRIQLERLLRQLKVRL